MPTSPMTPESSHLMQADRLPDALSYLDKAVQIASGVLDRDAGSLSVTFELVASLVFHSQALVNVGEPERALEQANRAGALPHMNCGMP